MSSSLGVSTGSSGVYSALVDTDSAGNSAGGLSAETRFVSADQAHISVGDLVGASIKLMSTLGNGALAPRSIGVTYSRDEQLSSIRASLTRSSDLVRLVPESAAVHAYIDQTGVAARYDTTALVDLGDHGLTVSVVDHSGAVLMTEYSEALAGAALDHSLAAFVTDKAAAPLGRHTDNKLLVARCHVAKEQLSSARSVTIDLPREPLTLTRVEFETIIADDVKRTITLIHKVLADPAHTVEALVLIGGGAHIPAVRTAIADAVDVPVLEFDEPEAVAAKGAALLADSVKSLHYPLVGSAISERTGSAVKASGALIGALVVGGLVLGYGAKELTPTADTPISPAGTGSTTSHATSDVVPTVGSTLIPSYDPLPSALPDTTQVYRNPVTTTAAYPTHKYTLPPAPLPDTSTETTPTTLPNTTAPTTTESTTTSPTTTESMWPTIPGLTLPEPPSWWPELPGANAPQMPAVVPDDPSPTTDATETTTPALTPVG